MDLVPKDEEVIVVAREYMIPVFPNLLVSVKYNSITLHGIFKPIRAALNLSVRLTSQKRQKE